MEELTQKQRHSLVVNFHKKNAEKGKVFTVNHFLAMGMKRPTIFRILDRFETRGDVKRPLGSGRKPWKMTKSKRLQLKNHFNHHAGRSQRKWARNHGVSQSMETIDNFCVE